MKQQIFGGIERDEETGQMKRNRPASSEEASPELEAHSGSLRCDGSGSLPVSSAELLRVADMHDSRAKYLLSAAEVMWEEDGPEGIFRAGHRRNSEVFSKCAEIIRRHAEAMTVRQPEENSAYQPRETSQ